MTWPWRRPDVVLRLVLMLAFAEMLRSGFFAGFFPFYGVERLMLSASAIGLVTSAHYLSDALVKAAGGWLSERMRLGWLLAFSGVFSAFALWGLTQDGLVWMVALSALWGIFLSPIWPAVLTYVSRDSRPGYEARGVTVATAAIGPLLGLALLGTGYLAKNDLDLAHALLLGGGVLMALLGLSLVGLEGRPARPAKEPFRWARLLMLLPAAFVQTLSTGILTPVLFLFIAKINLDPLALALTIAVGVAFALPALWLGGKIADTQNPRYALIPGLLTAALGFFLIGYLPLRLGLSPLSLGLPAVLIGAGFGLFFPGWNGLVVKSLPDADRAAAWGGIMTVEALGYAVGPTLGGLAWDLFGPVGPFALGAALMLLVGGYYLWQLFGSR